MRYNLFLCSFGKLVTKCGYFMALCTLFRGYSVLSVQLQADIQFTSEYTEQGEIRGPLAGRELVLVVRISKIKFNFSRSFSRLQPSRPTNSPSPRVRRSARQKSHRPAGNTKLYSASSVSTALGRKVPKKKCAKKTVYSSEKPHSFVSLLSLRELQMEFRNFRLFFILTYRQRCGLRKK